MPCPGMTSNRVLLFQLYEDCFPLTVSLKVLIRIGSFVLHSVDRETSDNDEDCDNRSVRTVDDSKK